MSNANPVSYTNLNESMFKLNLDDTYIEPIDLDYAKVLLTLDYNTFKSCIWSEENSNENGEYWKPETYIHCAKKYLLNAINNNGLVKSSYKYSVKMLDCGRQYVKSFGIQSLQKQLRGYLTHKTLIDFDMVNAHPTILLYLCKRFYPNYEWTYLNKYVKARKWFLSKYNVSKTDILIMMNSKTINTKIPIDKEFKTAQCLLYDSTPQCLEFMNEFKTEKQNPKGKFLNKILCIFENMILQTALSTLATDDVKVKMFDGFMADSNINIVDTKNALNNATSEYGIKWSVKQPDLSLVDKLKDVKVQEEEILNYENVKAKFELNHFMIEHPLCFGKEYEIDGEKKYSLMNSSDFSILTKPFIYEDVENSKLVKKPILNRWVSDKTKRTYKSINFIPSNKIINTEYYNTFKGFDFDTTNKTYTPHKTIVADYINHISLFTDYDEKSTIYIVKYIAHMIQKTTEIPKTCIVLKSSQGMGKDLLLHFIEKMIGSSYFSETSDVNDVFGNYNSIIKDKIVLQINELEGKDGFCNKEKLKDIITQPASQMREKYEKGYKQTNYIRVFITSNNLTPIEVPWDDRRMTVFQSTQCKPSRSYFNKLWDSLDDNNAIYTLYDYFNTLDISDFVPDSDKHRPITEAYKDMRQVPPLYKYINEMFKNEEYKTEFEGDYQVHKRTQNIYIQPNKILSSHRHWASYNNLNNYKIDFKLLKGLLCKIGIFQTETKIGGKSPTTYYKIDLDVLRPKLKDMKIEGDIEEFDEDEFE